MKNEFEKNRIPKKIHYIWLGRKDKNKLSEVCLLSWKIYNPDFEIIEWNEENLNLEKICKESEFFNECLKRRLWAFMADYLRIKILYENGGIYIDTDVQCIKPINELLNHDLLLGYEINNDINTGIIGASKHNEFIKNVLNFYNNKIMDSKVYTIPNVMKSVISDMNAQGRKIKIWPQEYFSPYNYYEKFNINSITSNTYCIHWYDGSWTKNKQVSLFLQTKHIKNPIIKNVVKIKKYLGYYKRKIIKK